MLGFTENKNFIRKGRAKWQHCNLIQYSDAIKFTSTLNHLNVFLTTFSSNMIINSEFTTWSRCFWLFGSCDRIRYMGHIELNCVLNSNYEGIPTKFTSKTKYKFSLDLLKLKMRMFDWAVKQEKGKGCQATLRSTDRTVYLFFLTQKPFKKGCPEIFGYNLHSNSRTYVAKCHHVVRYQKPNHPRCLNSPKKTINITLLGRPRLACDEAGVHCATLYHSAGLGITIVNTRLSRGTAVSKSFGL